MNEGLRTGPAGLDAQSLHDMRERADVWLADRSYTAELARDVVALTDEVERLVGCVAEAERQRDEALAALRDEMQWDMGGVPENEYKRRARIAEAALADARDALERITKLTAHHRTPRRTEDTVENAAAAGLEPARRIAREVLVRLNQEAE